MKIKIYIIMLASLMLVGCEQSDNVNNSVNDIDNEIIQFSTDENTIKISEIPEDIREDENSKNYNDYTVQDTTFGEMKINGTDSSIEYEIDGADIIYKGIRYKGLYEAATNIEIPCDASTFINFMIKCTSIDEDVVITYINENKQTDIEESINYEDTTISFLDDLSYMPEYIEIKDKYGKDVTCCVEVLNTSGKLMAALYSCDSYITYIGDSSPIEVDMSKYCNNSETDVDKTIENESTEIIDDNTEELEDDNMEDTNGENDQ